MSQGETSRTSDSIIPEATAVVARCKLPDVLRGYFTLTPVRRKHALKISVLHKVALIEP
jgi:hypothetical protein